MNEKLRTHVEKLFADAPKTRRAVELKEELLANLMDRFNDLLAQGHTEEEALKLVINSIGDVDELIRSLRETDVMDYSQMQKERKKTALIVTLAVGMYALSIILMIVGIAAFRFNAVVMVCTMLIISLAATCILVYHFMSRPKYVKADDTIVEEFKQWKSESSRTEKVRKSISSILWTSTVAVYFLISFLFHIWAFSWIIFLLAAVADKIISLSYQLKEEKHE